MALRTEQNSFDQVTSPLLMKQKKPVAGNHGHQYYCFYVQACLIITIQAPESGGCCISIYTHMLAVAPGFELYNTVNQRKKGVILSHSDVFTWMKLCAQLAHEDISCPHGLSSKAFYTAPLSLTVSSIL